tara:strand:+ start:1135 stop:1698 length:564 start_codon:yes stop_codon:yes gene_type:complete
METMKSLLSRRSISKLTTPHPSKEEMRDVYQAALRAPDHGWLRPWKFIEITGESRHKLGKAFVNVTKKNEELDEERENKIAALPLRSPMIIIVIAKINYDKPNVPRLEQIQSASAAAQNILIALHDKGYGAYWRTGKYSTERNLHITQELSLDKNDEVLGYLYVGTPSGDTPRIPELENEDFVTYWS